MCGEKGHTTARLAALRRTAARASELLAFCTGLSAHGTVRCRATRGAVVCVCATLAPAGAHQHDSEEVAYLQASWSTCHWLIAVLSAQQGTFFR